MRPRAQAFVLLVGLLLPTVSYAQAPILPPANDPKGRVLMEVVGTLERDLEELGRKRRAFATRRDELETQLAIVQEGISEAQSELDRTQRQMERMTRSIVHMREPDDTLLLFSSMKYHDLHVYSRLIRKTAVRLADRLAVMVTARRELAARRDALLKQKQRLDSQRDALLAQIAEVESVLSRKKRELADRLGKIAAVENLFMPVGQAAESTTVPPPGSVNLADLDGKKELQIPISPGRVIKGFEDAAEPPMGTEKMQRGWILVPFFKGKKKDAMEAAFVRSPVPGVAAFVGDVPGFGYTLVVDHGHGFHTVYANLHKSMVLKGEAVTQGMLIGSVRSQRPGVDLPYLYFEMRKNRLAVDPRPWFRLRAVEPTEAQ